MAGNALAINATNRKLHEQQCKRIDDLEAKLKKLIDDQNDVVYDELGQIKAALARIEAKLGDGSAPAPTSQTKKG